MASLLRCASCEGLSPASRAACVHCDAPRAPGLARRLLGGVVTVATGGAFMATLMACYGAARPAMINEPGAGDADGDGHTSLAAGGDDCDDGNPDIYPGATEVGDDDVDQNCDGATDPAGAAPVEHTPEGTVDGAAEGDPGVPN
jgi:hypothetical protein